MIVLLNGPFGVGKSTVARVLVNRLPGAVLYDPERLGAWLRETLQPLDPREDYQDYAVWRQLVVDGALRLLEVYAGPLVIPMTIWRRQYFDEIVGGLRAAGHDVRCLRLTVSRESLMERILGRPDAEGSHDWCISHVDSGLAVAADPHFGVEVATEGRSPAEVGQAIIALLGREGSPGSRAAR